MAAIRIRLIFVAKCLIFLIMVKLHLVSVSAQCKFTNLHCEALNKDAVEVTRCVIKAVSRDDNYASVFLKIKKIVRTAMVRISLFKRANGWKPFLYDVTFDACKFMKNPKANPLASFFYDFIANYGNLTHPCPYDHDCYLDKFRILNSTLRLPFPAGEYAVDTQWKINNEMWFRANGSCKILV